MGSHHVGGISKLKCEQQKHQEEAEKEQYHKFLSQFTMENFLEKVPTHDPNGAEIPKWKREMMAKKAAEKGKKEAIQKRAKEDEDRKMAAMPVWKKQLIEEKMDDPKSANGDAEKHWDQRSAGVNMDTVVSGLQQKLQNLKAQGQKNESSAVAATLTTTEETGDFKMALRKFSQHGDGGPRQN